MLLVETSAWNEARCEPLPSLASAPNARNSPMISSQATSDLTGLSKMASRVLLCLRESRWCMILIYSITPRLSSRIKEVSERVPSEHELVIPVQAVCQ
jgi:hypothetical protein